MNISRFAKLGATPLIALGLSMALTGCGSSSISQGNFGLANTMITGQIQDGTYSPGFNFGLFSNIHEFYGREDMLKIENIHPKDRDNVLFKDLDLIVTFVTNPEKAKNFIIQTSDVERDGNGINHIGTKRIDRDARNIIGESVRNFSSLEVLNDPTILEKQFKKDL